MKQKILLINPPFTQLNTPYPATAYLKGFLNTKRIKSNQIDLGIETILKLFSKKGVKELFDVAKDEIGKGTQNSQRIFYLKDSYIYTIDKVISFLQNADPTLAHLICGRNFLPEASKFEHMEDIEWAFGTMGIRDQARHMATLYLEDLSDFIVDLVDHNFGFSRYAERLGLSAHSFDDLHEELNFRDSYISTLMLSILKEKINEIKPDLVCLSVPFPGNLFAAFKCGQWLKKFHPEIKIAMGGGYPNTELRSLADPRVFDYVDFITLDDGEVPLMGLLSYLNNENDRVKLKRTYILQNGVVTYCNENKNSDIKQNQVGTPDYEGLPLKKYLSVIQLTNPMHRLWSDGRWNKLTMAHGCYWGKCKFCDISLDYIKVYEASSAGIIVDRMEELIRETGETGFHFVDEAAPPTLMKAVALEILKRKLIVSWWTNIRFEKSFHYDLCRLLAASGCIAVSGGLEVASDRLLRLIAKGVSIKQVSRVNDNFNRAGIMVHAYLMYGFPTQTAQETIDSLEVVRQMFEEEVLQSAFWHRFAMTAHSPVGIQPNKFKVKNLTKKVGTFANNDLEHEDPTGANHAKFSSGLRKSLYNYMHGVCLDHPLQNWFKHKVPKTTIPPNLIAGYLAIPDGRETRSSHSLVWVGGSLIYDKDNFVIKIFSIQDTIEIDCPKHKGKWIESVIKLMLPIEKEKSFTHKMLQESYEKEGFKDFLLFWNSEIMEELKEIGLLIL